MPFTIDTDNNISAFATQEKAAASTTSPFESFTGQKELAQLASAWPEERLVAIYNGLPGANPVKTFKTAKVGATKIWDAVQGLAEAAKPVTEPAKPKATKKAKGSAPAAKAAPAKGKATKQATPATPAPNAKKSAATEKKPQGVRGGSKTAQVVAMLQRKNGATLSEIMEKMDWQRHTVRGFMAGAMKKAGYTVESFKPEGASALTASTPRCSSTERWRRVRRADDRQERSRVKAVARRLCRLEGANCPSRSWGRTTIRVDFVERDGTASNPQRIARGGESSYRYSLLL
jgi:hypothetical protein